MFLCTHKILTLDEVAKGKKPIELASEGEVVGVLLEVAAELGE